MVMTLNKLHSARTGLIVVLCCWAAVVLGADSTEVELRDAVDQLMSAVQNNDDAAVDAVTCAGLLAQAQADRRVRLGLLPGGDQSNATQLQDSYRTAVYSRVFDWLAHGRSVVAVTTGRVLTSDPAAAGHEYFMDNADDTGAPMEITASGIIGVTLAPHDVNVDIQVFHVGEKWCLLPVPMP